MTKKLVETILLDEVNNMIAIKEDIARIIYLGYIASRIVESMVDDAVKTGELLLPKRRKTKEKKGQITLWMGNSRQKRRGHTVLTSSDVCTVCMGKKNKKNGCH